MVQSRIVVRCEDYGTDLFILSAAHYRTNQTKENQAIGVKMKSSVFILYYSPLYNEIKGYLQK